MGKGRSSILVRLLVELFPPFVLCFYFRQTTAFHYFCPFIVVQVSELKKKLCANYCYIIIYIFCADCFCPFFFIIFYTWYWNARPNGQWYQHLLTLFAIFCESNTEGTYFWIMLINFTFVECACFVWYSTSVRLDLVWGDPVRLTGL